MNGLDYNVMRRTFDICGDGNKHGTYGNEMRCPIWAKQYTHTHICLQVHLKSVLSKR